MMTPPPRTPEPIDLRLLARYFDGTAIAEEKAQVVAWIGDDPHRRAAIAELNAAWASDARRLEARYDPDAAWTKVSSQLGIARPARISRPTRVWHAPVVGAWAAALIVAAVLGGWWLIASRHAQPTTQVAAARVYQTARAQRAVVRLSDGSEVTLNADSRLRVPGDFAPGKKRELYLEGEGYFNVVHDSAAPFTVRTSRGVARDLGTKFSVRAYADDATKQLEVVVAEGAVSIAAAAQNDSLVLRASEAGSVTETGELRAEHNVDVRARLGWTEGRLEFKNIALREVIPVLARWYDVEILIGDSLLADYPVTATLTGERFGDAIEAIARVVDARVVRRGSSTILVRKSIPPR